MSVCDPLTDRQIDTCDVCSATLRVGDFPFCKGDPQDHLTRPRGRFKSCEVEIDGQVHTISSIQDANRLEKEAGHRAADGEGSPIAFRAFHQNSSNQDTNCMGPSPQVPLPRRPKLQPGRGAAEHALHPAVRKIYGRD